jgi:hypothetical protein
LDGESTLSAEDLAAPFLCILVDQNYSLVYLSVQCRINYTTVSLSEHSDINFYLKLNKIGRYHLLKNAQTNATDHDWLDAIVASKNDVPTIFYWLQHNPSLCNKVDLTALEELENDVSDPPETPMETAGTNTMPMAAAVSPSPKS